MRKRRQGLGWNGKKVSPTNSKIPLRQTDTLYDSLTYDKKTKSIDMMSYGLYHQKGFTTPQGSRVPARKFIDFRKIWSGVGIATQQLKIQNRITKFLKDKVKAHK